MKHFAKLAAAAIIAAATLPANAETLRFASVTSVSAKEASTKFAELLKEKTNGDLTVNVFMDNQLGDDRVATESTIFGDIDIALSSTSPLANLFPDLFLFDAPFLFLSPEQTYEQLDGPVGQTILGTLESKGLKGLGFWENGFRNFTDNNVAVKRPADLAGMKVRTMENEVHLNAWRAFGANPTPMAFTELFTALQQGTVDAQENPLGIIDGNRFQEVQNHISMTQHVYTPYMFFMNLDKFNGMSAEQQAAITEAATEAMNWQRERSQELEQEILTRFAERGVTVVELAPEDKAVWQQVVADNNIYDLVKSKMQHPELLDQVLAAE